MTTKTDVHIPTIRELCDGRLIGKRVFHEEKLPYHEVSGIVQKLFIAGDNVILVAGWDRGDPFSPSVGLDALIRVGRDGRITVRDRLPYGGNEWTFTV